jgi:hypothetical protein
MTRRTELVLALVLFMAALPAQAATKVFLHDALSLGIIPGGKDITFRKCNNTQGSAKVTAVTNTIAGPITGQYFPSATAGHIITKTAGGTRTVWICDPLSSGVTIAGLIAGNIWGLESNGLANAGGRFEVLRWDVSRGGIVKSLGISGDNLQTEWTTSAAVDISLGFTPSSTAFNTGDRIVIVHYNDDAASNQGSGRTWTLDYDAGTGVDGDTYFSFTETISFSADSNNNPPFGITAEVQPLPFGIVAWYRRPEFHLRPLAVA